MEVGVRERRVLQGSLELSMIKSWKGCFREEKSSRASSELWLWERTLGGQSLSRVGRRRGTGSWEQKQLQRLGRISGKWVTEKMEQTIKKRVGVTWGVTVCKKVAHCLEFYRMGESASQITQH